MTESEMLELAAKAGGIDYKPDNKDWKHDDHCAFWDYDDFCTCGARWNPRDDDGDALRLAVAIGQRTGCIISVDVDHATCAFFRDDVEIKEHPADAGEYPNTDNGPWDFNAGLRRAILRAAAEIGRNMK